MSKLSNSYLTLPDGSTGFAEKTYAYDSLNRITNRITSRCSQSGSTTSYFTILTETLTYHSALIGGDMSTCDLVATLRTSADGYDKTYRYTYDGNGNILYDGRNSYVYDSANQLIRENNLDANKTWVWIYDDAGNILSKKEYAYTTGTLTGSGTTISYVYGDAEWGDLLTSYNGKAITYDTIGNPLTYGYWVFTWEQGRQLASMSDGISNWTFYYDSNCMRTERASRLVVSYDYDAWGKITAVSVK